MRTYRPRLSMMLLVLFALGASEALLADPAYQAFMNQLSNDCYTKNIGVGEVGRLVDGESTNSAWFLDQTARLFHGKATRQEWLQSMEAFLQAKPSNNGVKCLFGLLPDATVSPPGSVPPPPGI